MGWFKTAGQQEVTENEDQQEGTDMSESVEEKEREQDENRFDELFGLLSNSRRRAVLELLAETDESTVYELSRHIAGRENGTDPQQVTAVERKRVYIGLHQNHLPLMNRHGVIEYDKDRGTVALADDPSATPYLALIQQRGERSVNRQLALVGVVGALTVGGLLTAWAGFSTPLEAWSVLAILFLAVLAYDLWNSAS